MKKSFLGSVAMIGICLIASGCATVINGTTQDVPVSSNPEGATAKTHSGLSCTTPCSFTLKRNTDHIITIQKEGFEPASVTCEHVMSPAVAGNALIGGLIGVGIDAASGALFKLSPHTIHVELKPLIAKTDAPVLTTEKIKELEEQKKAGLVSEEEYSSRKANLVAEIEKK